MCCGHNVHTHNNLVPHMVCMGLNIDTDNCSGVQFTQLQWISFRWYTFRFPLSLAGIEFCLISFSSSKVYDICWSYAQVPVYLPQGLCLWGETGDESLELFMNECILLVNLWCLAHWFVYGQIISTPCNFVHVQCMYGKKKDTPMHVDWIW